MLVLLRSLIQTPEILLMDEPFSALDIYKGLDFRDTYLTYLEQHRITSVFVSHNLEETVYLADEIAFLNRVKDGFLAIVGREKVNLSRPRKNIGIHHISVTELASQFRKKYINDKNTA